MMRRFEHGPFRSAAKRMVIGLVVLLAIWLAYKLVYPPAFQWYVGESNPKLHYANSQAVSPAEFESIAASLTKAARQAKAAELVSDQQDPFARKVKLEILANTASYLRDTEYPHIKYFRDAGIRRYVGPETCLGCHPTHQGRRTRTAPTRGSTPCRTWWIRSISPSKAMPAGSPPTAMTAGRSMAPGRARSRSARSIAPAASPAAFPGPAGRPWSPPEPEGKQGAVELRSEGCGQCHIGGNYQPATEKMMPIGDVPANAKEGIDCLICHAAEYDMNQRHVIRDQGGLRWNQDRSLRSALTVRQVANPNCLRCHQHNMGGDAYVHNEAAKSLGYENRRLLHQGAKRGNPFSPADDVHAAANIQCTDCHVPEGHKIPRGLGGVDLVANDLPGKEVSCESCHSRAPHNNADYKALLNGHIARLACETCHIKSLQDNNVVLRDWVHPTWDADEGVYLPTDIYRSGQVGRGFTYLWFNGNGTFLANALGNNPNGSADYNPLMQQLTRINDPEVIAAVRAQAQSLKQTYPDIDVDAYVTAATEPVVPTLTGHACRASGDHRPEPAPGHESRDQPDLSLQALQRHDV